MKGKVRIPERVGKQPQHSEEIFSISSMLKLALREYIKL
jgi:hypothetical protein